MLFFSITVTMFLRKTVSASKGYKMNMPRVLFLKLKNPVLNTSEKKFVFGIMLSFIECIEQTNFGYGSKIVKRV